MNSTTFAPRELAGTETIDTAPADGLLAPLKRAFAALRSARNDRMMRSELAELDDALLRDIGVADDEIYRVRARERFTPRAWRA